MRDDDMVRLQMLCESENIPLNMEMAATEEMLKIALDLKPKAICIVPERREERTTEGGLDVAGGHNHITPIVRELTKSGSRVSLFIEAVEPQIRAAASTGAAVIEFHTGAYAHALDDGDDAAAEGYLESFIKGAKLADELGLEVHFGHGLTFDNVGAVAAIPECMELNIGHFIIGEAIFMGLEAAITEMRRLATEARAA
jgi:pyridoxine 5-phosphate synthase